NQSSYNSTFTTPAGHAPITFLAASGDSGQSGGPMWPSVAPSVVAVGGASLALTIDGRHQSEGAWSGLGGGYSWVQTQPGSQRSVQRTGRRSTPDVAFVGDPNTGVLVYETPPGSLEGSWVVVGGTSLGTPAWAAIVAIADQGRALAGKGGLDGTSRTLP